MRRSTRTPLTETFKFGDVRVDFTKMELSREGNPFWVNSPTLDHVKKLLFDTAYPEWMWNTVVVSVVSTFVSLVASVLAAYAIELAAVFYFFCLTAYFFINRPA